MGVRQMSIPADGRDRHEEAAEREGTTRREGAQPIGEPGLPEESYLDREESWLRFNERVLELAEDESVPLLERVKFLAIFSTNLDEFFMIRVAGVHDQVEARIDARGPEGLSPMETLRGIAEKVAALDRRHSRQFREVIRPQLAEHGIRVVSSTESAASPELMERHFRDDLLQAVEDELRRRRFAEVVRLEVDADMDPAIRSRLIDWLGVEELQVYDVDGLLDLSDLSQIFGVEGHADLRLPTWTPIVHPA